MFTRCRALFAVLATATLAHAQPAAPSRDDIARKAVAFLVSQQHPSGGWNIDPERPTFPAITGLALHGMLRDPGVDPTGEPVTKAVAFILSMQQPDGGIYDRILPNYNTAICLSALCAVPNPSPGVSAAIKNARDFLKGLQNGEESSGLDSAPVGRDHPFYGGFGYGQHGRPDMSNTSFAIEALHASGLDARDPAFQRALVFLQRCQMLETAGGRTVNDQPYAAGSTQGGFIYATSASKDAVGAGQTNAGEIAESLSGPPGLAASVSFKNGPDAKPLALSADQIAHRITERQHLSSNKDMSFEFMVVPGVGSTRAAASVFEVRTSAAPDQARQLEILLGQAFRDELADASSVRVYPVEHWKGESRLRCYGSMTYAGFKSYLHAGLTKDDPRVAAALDWMRHNYTLEENPGVGTDGLYYYFVVFAKALHANGERTIRAAPPGGAMTPRDWAADLTARLASLQNADGSFRPVDDRWMENDPVLITAYALLALGYAR